MDRKEIEGVIIELLAETGDTDKTALEAQLASDPEHDLHIDSLQAVELVVGIEERLGVYIPDDALTPEVCRSVRSLIELVEPELARSEPEDSGEDSTARAQRIHKMRETLQRNKEKREEGD